MCLGPEVSAAVAIISSLVGATGAVVSGVATKQAADFNAEIIRRNKQFEVDKASFEADQKRRDVQKLLARQAVGFAKSGVVLSEGTPIEVLADTAAQGELDAQTIIYGGDIRAATLEQEARLSEARGRSALTGSFFTAGATLLTGVAGTGLLKAPGTGGFTGPRTIASRGLLS